jgi:hypothetical protein
MAELNQIMKNSESQSVSVLERFVRLKKDAYTRLSQALTIDTDASKSANRNEAQVDAVILAYEHSKDLIEKALHFYEANMQELSRDEEAKKFKAQLTQMRAQTIDRMQTLKTDRVTNTNKSSSATLYPQISKSKSSIELSDENFLAIGDDILNECIIIDDVEEEASAHPKTSKLHDKLKDFTKATEVIRIDDGVQLFYIADDGTVSTPSYPTTLSVYSFDQNQVSGKVCGFVRVGSWLYPLTLNESPAMKTNFNAYIFPNKDQDEVNGKMNCFVGITMANTISSEERLLFEDVLGSYSALIYQDASSSSQYVLIYSFILMLCSLFHL